MRIFSRWASREDNRGSIQPAPRRPSDTKNGVSVLRSDVIISGDIAATADLDVDGRVRGDVTCGTLVQCAGSDIIGNIIAEVACLAGSMEGTIVAHHLKVDRSARINGDIRYETIIVEEGACVDGQLRRGTIDDSSGTGAIEKQSA